MATANLMSAQTRHPVVAIVQARMRSTRLPGKVLLPLGGKPVLWHVVHRAASTQNIQKVIVATSLDSSDDPIENWCAENGVSCFRGSLEDVLDRYYQAAVTSGARSVVRITADCPLIDPIVLEALVNHYLEESFDYCSLVGEFPDGLDCEILSIDALETARGQAVLPSEREHVTPYIYKNPSAFKLGQIRPFWGLSHHRWTLDELDDYKFLTAVFAELFGQKPFFLTPDILLFLEKRPDLIALNEHFERNEGYRNSMVEDAAWVQSQ